MTEAMIVNTLLQLLVESTMQRNALERDLTQIRTTLDELAAEIASQRDAEPSTARTAEQPEGIADDPPEGSVPPAG